MAEHDAARAHDLGLASNELSKRPLDRLAVDVAAPGGGEDGDVRSKVAEHTGPVPGRVLVEDRSVRRLEEIDEGSAIATCVLARDGEVRLDRVAEATEVGGEIGVASHLLLIGE